jgi:hypothetical protein
MSDHHKIKISKLDAARRQLDCAIELWFANGDLVSIHTLACASHQIIHDIHKKRVRHKELIFDSILIKDEYRKEANDLIRKNMIFFKHADKDPEGVTEFVPRLSEGFIVMSIHGLGNLGVSPTDSEAAFLWWHAIQNPRFLSEAGRQQLNKIPVNNLEEIRTFPKNEFFKGFLRSKTEARIRNITL